MLDVPAILKRAADKCGFVRTRWVEKDIPTNLSNISVLVFFGDVRSSYILSSMLLKRYREQIKGSKYFILCTWPGLGGLFPYVNEIWAIQDESILRKFYSEAVGFDNLSDLQIQFKRELNHWFEDVAGVEVFTPYYQDGITQEFWDRFKFVQKYLISVPSSSVVGNEFNLKMMKVGVKALIYPVEFIRTWQRGKLHLSKCPKDFWVNLADSLIQAGIVPVVYQNFATHNISSELAEKCIYTTEKDVAKLLGIMRAVGCVVDVFSGISRWAMAARAPFIAVDERTRYNGQKEFEIDGLLCDNNLPRQHIFTFPTIIEQGNLSYWKNNIYDVLTATMVSFLSKMDRDKWPSPLERDEVVQYKNVRQRKLKQMGTRFIKVNPDLR
jgi:hypothetical protein